jgi:hypothetical protein
MGFNHDCERTVKTKEEIFECVMIYSGSGRQGRKQR